MQTLIIDKKNLLTTTNILKSTYINLMKTNDTQRQLTKPPRVHIRINNRETRTSNIQNHEQPTAISNIETKTNSINSWKQPNTISRWTKQAQWNLLLG